MDPHTPHNDHATTVESSGIGRALPTLQLPPVPFARHESLPVGTSVSDLLGALSADSLTLEPMADEPFFAQPHADFHAAVERRGRRERRSSPRSTGERRAFTSEHLAAPDHGPADPRPQADPTHEHAPRQAAPIDPRLPELPGPTPHELEPALPYTLPSPGVSGDTVRTTRASVATMPLTYPSIGTVGSTPPFAPVTPVAPPAELPTEQARIEAPVTLAPTGLDAVYAGGAPIPVGRLDPWTEILAEARTPQAGPASPAIAPGAGLAPVVASVAAAPSAWYGGQVHVDDAMLVWNAPGTQAPLAPSVAAMIAPARSAAAAPLATGRLAPPTLVAASASAAPAASTVRGPLGRLLRGALLIGVPAGLGIGIALAVNEYLL